MKDRSCKPNPALGAGLLLSAAAVLKYVFTHNKSLFGSSLQLLPESSGDEHSSFGVRPDFNIA